MQQLTLFSLEPHASPSPLLDSEQGLKTLVEISPSSFLELLTTLNPGGSYGKMCLESFRPGPTRRLIKRETSGKQTILKPSSVVFRNSGILSHGESLTLNTMEHHSVVVESSLLDIVETGDVPQRYYLSPKACAGILRRAKSRARSLPPELLEELRRIAAME